MRKTGLYALGLLVLSLLMLGVVVPALAEDGPVNVQVDHAGMDPRIGPIDPAFRTDGRLESPHSRDVLDYNSEGNGETNGNYFNIPGGGTGEGSGGSSDGKTSWWKDHGKGLLLGALEGIGIAAGVVAIGALLALSAPVVGAMALGALIGTAAYGAIAGASKYNPWEAAVNGLIGAVSGGIGAGLGAVSAGVKTLVIGAVDAVGSGLASAAAYGLNTSSPTTEGYLSSFGIGAAIGGATFGLGRLASMTGIGQKVSGVIQGKGALDLADELHTSAPRMGDNVVDTVAREERAAAQTAVQTNPQVARRVLTTVGDEGESAGQKVISTLETQEKAATPVPFVQSKPSSKVLGSNMEKAKIVRPPQTAAHHLVAGSDDRAEIARDVLDEFHIDINDAENGVFLPQKHTSTAPGLYHPSLHTADYYDEINRRLLRATSRDKALEILAGIRSELLDGSFPS